MLFVIAMGIGEEGFSKNLIHPNSAITDYFRSNTANIGSGASWGQKSSWESSNDNITWSPATEVPTSAANTITIRNGFNIDIKSGTESADQLIIETGATLTFSNGSFTLNDGVGTDMILEGANSNFIISSNTDPSIIGNSLVRINSGAKITLSGNGNIAFYQSNQFSYADASNFEYTGTNIPVIQITFFQNQDVNAIPLFIYNSVIGSALGGGAATTINGKLEVSLGKTINVSNVLGILTVRNGIIGAGNYVNSTSAVTNITGAFAEIGGTGNLDSYITIANGSTTTLTSNKNYLLSNLFLVNGIYDFGTNIMSTLSGISTITVGSTGTLQTANIYGLLGAGSIGNNLVLSSLPNGSTVEYYSTVANQIVTSRPDYYNLILSGSFTKTPSGTFSPLGTVFISGSAIFNCSGKNIGNTNTSLTMTGGRLIVSTGGTQPSMANAYNLSAGVIQFNGASAETIRTQTYQNIEVTGVGVGNSSGNITLNSGGTFTVKSSGIFVINIDAIIGPTGIQTVIVETGGTFKTGDANGFSGGTGATATSVRSDIENIILQPGSTVEYSKLANQNITNQGVTNPTTGNYYNLTLSGTGIKTAPVTDLTILGNLSRAGTHIFNEGAGRVVFAGTTIQTYSATVGTQPINFYNVTNTNNAGLQLDSTIGIQNELNLNANAKLNLNTGDINMRSSATRTAYITDLGTTLPSTNITYGATGLFSIERYLMSVKAWRLLATPIHSSTLSITDSWREGGSLVSTGYGTQITGPSTISTGTDQTTARGSMKWYNKATNNYVEINNTSDAIARPQGYYVFVRGDRAQYIAGAGSATNLRMRGKILTGQQTFTAPLSKGANDGFESVGNPYPSQINYKTATKTNLETSFTVWNPFAGFYGVGRFIQYSRNIANGDYFNGVTMLNTIESGQAFFIQSAGGFSGSITIKESDKLSGSNTVSRTATSGRTGVFEPTLEINLHSVGLSTPSFLDQAVINFDNTFRNEFDGMDVRKFMNANDNLSIKLGNKNVIVERRKSLQNTDTLFLSLTNTRIAQYRFEIDPSILGNLPLNGYLKDNFLQTETKVSLRDVTNINFNITTDAASRAADRFMIVFKTAIIPGQFTGNFIAIAAEKNSDKTNTLKWSYSNELNIALYSIERSNNGTVFTGIGNKNAGNLSNIGLYIFIDSLNVFGNNYYRIKATSTTGLVQYSAIVKVVENDLKPFFVVRPNPIVNKTLQINFERMQGDYNLRLIAKQGATVFSKQINISSVKEVRNIALSSTFAAGVYELILVDGMGNQLLQNIFIK